MGRNRVINHRRTPDVWRRLTEGNGTELARCCNGGTGLAGLGGAPAGPANDLSVACRRMLVPS